MITLLLRCWIFLRGNQLSDATYLYCRVMLVAVDLEVSLDQLVNGLVVINIFLAKPPLKMKGKRYSTALYTLL